MADLILGPVVDATISKVIALATEKLGLAWGLKDDMKKFRLILSLVGGVLHDADEKHVNGHPKDLRAWLEELRAIVDEADDALEEMAYEDLRRKVAARKPMWKFEYSFEASIQVFATIQKLVHGVEFCDFRSKIL